MSEQMDFFDLGIPADDEERLLQIVLPAIRSAAQARGLASDEVTHERKKAHTSVFILDNLLLRIKCGRKLRYIKFRSLPEKQHLLLEPYKVDQTKQDREAGFIRIHIPPDYNLTPELEELLTAVTANCLDDIAPSFDCCSKFEVCSDARVCVQSDKTIFTGCRYRRILSSGKIYYGRNRNVD